MLRWTGGTRARAELRYNYTTSTVGTAQQSTVAAAAAAARNKDSRTDITATTTSSATGQHAGGVGNPHAHAQAAAAEAAATSSSVLGDHYLHQPLQVVPLGGPPPFTTRVDALGEEDLSESLLLPCPPSASAAAAAAGMVPGGGGGHKRHLDPAAFFAAHRKRGSGGHGREGPCQAPVARSPPTLGQRASADVRVAERPMETPADAIGDAARRRRTAEQQQQRLLARGKLDDRQKMKKRDVRAVNNNRRRVNPLGVRRPEKTLDVQSLRRCVRTGRAMDDGHEQQQRQRQLDLQQQDMTEGGAAAERAVLVPSRSGVQAALAMLAEETSKLPIPTAVHGHYPHPAFQGNATGPDGAPRPLPVMAAYLEKWGCATDGNAVHGAAGGAAWGLDCGAPPTFHVNPLTFASSSAAEGGWGGFDAQASFAPGALPQEEEGGAAVGLAASPVFFSARRPLHEHRNPISVDGSLPGEMAPHYHQQMLTMAPGYFPGCDDAGVLGGGGQGSGFLDPPPFAFDDH